eukprot:126802_1
MKTNATHHTVSTLREHGVLTKKQSLKHLRDTQIATEQIVMGQGKSNTDDHRNSESMDSMKTNATHHTVSTLREHGVLTKKQSLKHLRDTQIATEQIVMGQGKSNTDDHRNSESMDSMKTNATQLIVSILRKHGGVLTKKQLHKHIRKNNGGIHWSNSNFNAELGHLKKFLMQQKNIFLVVPETKSKNFKVTLRDTSDAEQSSDRQPRYPQKKKKQKQKKKIQIPKMCIRKYPRRTHTI